MNWFIKGRNAKYKREMKYDNWREPLRDDCKLHLGATYTGTVCVIEN